MARQLVRRQRRRLTLGILGAVIFLAGGAVVWRMFFAPSYVIRMSPNSLITLSRRSAADEPAPTVTEKRAYTVPADVPRYLLIDKLGVNARVLALGRDTDGKIGVPPGIWDVAWYTGSAKPGAAGVTFIDGHISGPSMPAVFRDLHHLSPGDDITVERGDGQRTAYRVRTVETRALATIDMDQVLTTRSDDKSTLVLMTCGGTFNAHEYSYDQREIVVAGRL